MYSRRVGGRIRNFEASGALHNSALVMQDDVTHSYWSVISSKAIAGAEAGTKLEDLPIVEKTTWKQWRSRHPDTWVLSVDGSEHTPRNPYSDYLSSAETFRGAVAADDRLRAKSSIFAFELAGVPFAIPHRLAERGWVGRAGEHTVFIHRAAGADVLRSTKAYFLEHAGKLVALRRRSQRWTAPSLGRLDPDSGTFEGGGVRLAQVPGLDTFWYIWSRYHPETRLLGSERDSR